MAKVIVIPKSQNVRDEKKYSSIFEKVDFSKYRNPTKSEIEILEKNQNMSTDPDWKNLFVSEVFSPENIKNSEFYGTVVVGKLDKNFLQF